MSNGVTDYVCPSCVGELALENDMFTCLDCNTRYPIINGVPRFVGQLWEQERTAATFGYEWRAFSRGQFDKNSVFGLEISETAQYFLDSVGLRREDLAGLSVLDAGTGSGRIPMALEDLGCTIYAADIHDGLDIVAANLSLKRVRFAQADIMRLPYRDEFFDIVWTSGVLHHTPDTAVAFHELTRKVKRGGKMFVSVYARSHHHYRLLRRLFPFGRYLSPSFNYVIAAVLAAPLYLLFNTTLAIVRLIMGNDKPPYKVLGFAIEDIRPKSYSSIVLNVFDQLHPKYQREHSKEEMQAMFESNGFVDVLATNTVNMIEMRGVKP